jgi:DNA-binding CsgD family transcriptional regulator
MWSCTTAGHKKFTLALLLSMAASFLGALPPSTHPLPFELSASLPYQLYWILALAIGAAACGRLAIVSQRANDAHLWHLFLFMCAFLLVMLCAALFEFNRAGEFDENLPRIASMVCLCLIPILGPGITKTRAELRLALRLERFLSLGGAALAVHYLASAALFYAVQYQGGRARYFDGHRVFPAFALYLLVSITTLYIGLAFYLARDRFSSRERRAISRIAIVCVCSVPPMLIVDELRFLIPPLWALYPREDLFVLPAFFSTACISVMDYTAAYAQGLGAAAEAGAPASPPLRTSEVAAISRSFKDERLTDRERQVATLLARGMTYKQIRLELGISEGTVQSHVARIYRKLGVNCKEELMLRHGREQADGSPRGDII